MWLRDAILPCAVIGLAAGCFLRPPGLSGAAPPRPVSGPIYGIVVDDEGKPRAGVKVTAYFSNSNPLGNTNPLVGNSGGQYRLAEIPAGAIAEAETDATGGFVLSPAATGVYNVEAVGSPDSKAWSASVTLDDANGQVGVGALQLQPVGSIVGRVRAVDEGVSDFTGTDVYVPGSSYIAKTTTDGSYAISNVPVGEFDLVAYHADLGEGRSGRAVAVVAKASAGAEALVLDFRFPELASITKAGSAEETDNGAAGAELDLHGRHFAFSKGLQINVFFTGAVPTKVTKLSDERVRVVVPPGANNGQVVLQVKDRSSNALPFRAIKKLRLIQDNPYVALGKVLDLAGLVEALDSDGIPIRPFEHDGKKVKHGPNVSYAGENDRIFVSAAGVVSGLATGTAKVTVSAGSLPPESRVVFVGDRPSPVESLHLAPGHLELFARPEQGAADPEFVTSATLSASIKTVDGRPRKVVWAVSDDTRIKLTAVDDLTVLVETTPGADEGMVMVTASAEDDRSVLATASVAVKADGGVLLEVR